MTLLEVTVAMPIVLAALAMFSQMMVAGTGMRSVDAESWRASNAAQIALEKMRNESWDELFSIYNADPFDDPLGAGTARGAHFAVDGLVTRDDDADGMVGEIILPLLNVGSAVVPEWQVREDLNMPDLGLPRDLDGDMVIDDEDHSSDYMVLPVVVRLRWQGRFGPREYRVSTLLSELH